MLLYFCSFHFFPSKHMNERESITISQQYIAALLFSFWSYLVTVPLHNEMSAIDSIIISYCSLCRRYFATHSSSVCICSNKMTKERLYQEIVAVFFVSFQFISFRFESEPKSRMMFQSKCVKSNTCKWNNFRFLCFFFFSFSNVTM